MSDPRYNQHAIPPDELDGQRYADDSLPLTSITNTYENPGATPNLRGVEVNTAKFHQMPVQVPPSGIDGFPPAIEITQEMDTTYAYDRDTGVDNTLEYARHVVSDSDEVNRSTIGTGGGKWAKAPTP